MQSKFNFQILAEKGEIYKTPEGNLKQISNKAPSHDDGVQVMPNGATKKAATGGVVLNDAHSVLSDSYTQVMNGDRNNSETEQIVRISKSEGNNYLEEFGFNPFLKSSVSPSKFLLALREERDNKVKKLSKPVLAKDKFGLNSQKSNEALRNTLPKDEELYEYVFQIQESKKQYSDVDFNMDKAQYGKSNTDDFIKQAEKMYNESVLNRESRGVQYEINKGNGLNPNFIQDKEILDQAEIVKNKKYLPYIQSPLYQRRLDTMQHDARNYDIQGINKLKVADGEVPFKNFEEYADYKKKKGMEIYRSSDIYKNVDNNQKGNLTDRLQRLQVLGLENEDKYKDTKGLYSYDGNYVQVKKFMKEKELDDALVHEFSHATHPHLSEIYLNEVFDVNKKADNFIQKYPQVKDEINYLKNPQEIRARVMQLRNNLHYYHDKPLLEDVPYNKEHIDKLKGEDSFKDLKLLFKDDEILRMLNDLASNKSNTSTIKQKAQYGGSTYVQRPISPLEIDKNKKALIEEEFKDRQTQLKSSTKNSANKAYYEKENEIKEANNRINKRQEQVNTLGIGLAPVPVLGEIYNTASTIANGVVDAAQGEYSDVGWSAADLALSKIPFKKQFNNLSNIKFSKSEDLKRELSSLSKKLNPKFQKTVNAQLKDGNDWSEMWYNDPSTTSKLDILENRRFNEIEASKVERENYRNMVTENFDELIKTNPEYTNSYKRVVEETPYIETNEWSGMKERIKNKEYLSRFLTPKEKIESFISGKKYAHNGNFGVSGYNIVPNQPKDERINLVSKYTPQITSTAIHEGNHGVTDANNFIPHKIQKQMASAFGDENISYGIGSHDNYLKKPTEVYARVQQIRHHMGLEPGQYINPEDIDDIISRGLKGKTPVDKRFFELIKNPSDFRKLMNTLPAAVLPIAASQIEEKQYGGMSEANNPLFKYL